MKNRTGYKVKIIILVLSLALALLLCEILLRTLGFKPRELRVHQYFSEEGWAGYDPELGWINRPGIFISEESGHAKMTFWENGQRASRQNREKSGRYLVYLVGCSYTQGYGVTDEETFAYRLNDIYPDIVFDNFGTGGYGTYQSLLRIKRELNKSGQKHPCLIIYGFFGGHIQRNVAASFWIMSLTERTGLWIRPPYVTLEKNTLHPHDYEVIKLWPMETHSSIISLLHKTEICTHDIPKYKALEATKCIMREMDKNVREKNSHLLVVLLDDIPLTIYDFLEAQGIDYVDCTNPCFFGNPSLWVGCNGYSHPNGLQHLFWAKVIKNWIDKNLSKKLLNQIIFPGDGLQALV